MSKIPTPKFKIGDKVIWKMNDHRKYNEKKYLQHLIKYWRRGRGGVLNKVTKKIIRRAYRVICKARRVEVAGIVCKGMYGVDIAEYNECYVGGVRGASSPLRFKYQLLFRWRRGRNILAMTTGIPVAEEFNLEKR